MKARTDSRGVFHLMVYNSDHAANVAGTVEKNASSGTQVLAALLQIEARQQRNMIAELAADFQMFVADGSQIWFHKGFLPKRIDTPAKYVNMLIDLLNGHNEQLTPLGLAIITSQ